RRPPLGGPAEPAPPPRLVNGTARAADGVAPVLCRGTRVLANCSPRMPASRTARSTVLAPLLPLVAALAVWAPLRHNFFWNDDFVHLYDIATRSLWSFSSELFLGQFYLVRNLVFAGLFHAFGPDPRPYFWSVLLTHALNLLLLERAIRGFTADLVLSCVGAVLSG